MSGTEACPCGGPGYTACCGPIHAGGAGLGVSAEALMRARYTAYVLGDEEFLMASWHDDTRPPGVGLDSGIEWLGLEVIDVQGGTGFDNDGTVEFRARFRRGDKYLELHEHSTFVRVDGEWRYVEGR